MEYIRGDDIVYKTICRSCGGKIRFRRSETLTSETSFSEHDETVKRQYVECPHCGMENYEPSGGWSF